MPSGWEERWEADVKGFRRVLGSCADCLWDGGSVLKVGEGSIPVSQY
jgi:hypothetical protein